MATVTRFAAFWRAFFAILLSGSLASAATEAEVEAWQIAVEANTADAYYRYLSLFPAGQYVDDAVSALSRLGLVGTPRDVSPVRPSAPVVRPVVGLF